MRGLVHNDLKLANILVQKDRKGLPIAKLTDFGLANVVDDSCIKVAGYVVQNTRGTTINYAGPDRLIAQFPVVSGAKAKMSDLYSFGMVIYAMVSKKEPWK